MSYKINNIEFLEDGKAIQYLYENKYVIDGDTMLINEQKINKIIGLNHANGVFYGGNISSFGKEFKNEYINVVTGIADHVSAQIGDISEAYSLLDNKIKDNKPNDLFELCSIVYEVVNEYFGDISSLDNRMNYYKSDDMLDEGEVNYISNLKHSNAAACVERAALSQNLLCHLGIKSYYKSSGIIKNNEKDAHSYNLIDYNGEYYLYDSSIPCLIDGKINPLISSLDKESFYLMLCPFPSDGISISVSHYNPLRDRYDSITYDSKRKKQITLESFGEDKSISL